MECASPVRKDRHLPQSQLPGVDEHSFRPPTQVDVVVLGLAQPALSRVHPQAARPQRGTRRSPDHPLRVRWKYIDSDVGSGTHSNLPPRASSSPPRSSVWGTSASVIIRSPQLRALPLGASTRTGATSRSATNSLLSSTSESNDRHRREQPRPIGAHPRPAHRCRTPPAPRRIGTYTGSRFTPCWWHAAWCRARRHQPWRRERPDRVCLRPRLWCR